MMKTTMVGSLCGEALVEAEHGSLLFLQCLMSQMGRKRLILHLVQYPIKLKQISTMSFEK